MADLLLWVTLAVVAVVVLLAAFAAYRRRSRRAQARSRAALNRLLAEADEIAEAARRNEADEPPQAP